MVVKIGHASSDEQRRAKGGKAGDQTGKEVLIQDWYLRADGWTAVFRPKDSQIAEKIAETMVQACTNNNIGYDQGQRTTLYKYAEKCNWDITKIIEKCECDCSSLVAVCINAAGISISKDMYTGNQKDVLSKTKKFEILTESKYLIKADYLKRGDILLGPGHTAIVVSIDEEKVVDGAKHFSKASAGTYKVTANKLNVRCGAGTDKDIITTLSKDTELKCYGYYSKVLNTSWLYVQFIYGNKTQTGFVSSKYITKIR